MKPLRCRKTAGFTLIELCAAVAIVALLAGLSLGAFSKMRASSRTATCVSNMRHIGLAITLYTQDNNTMLPGPLWRGQTPLYQVTPEGGFDLNSGNLLDFVGPYMSLQNLVPGQVSRAEAFSCPAWEAMSNAASEPVCYYSTGETVIGEGETAETIVPFGKCSDDPEKTIAPARLSQLPNMATLASVREFDRRGVYEGFYKDDPRVPQNPVHKTIRNVLYFDGHVATEPVGL